MTLSIHLPADAETRLREQAAAAGKDVTQFVQEAIEEKLASGQKFSAEVPKQGTAQWRAEFLAWIASHANQTAVADDSRESIYGDERD